MKKSFERWVVVGPHIYLMKKADIERIRMEVIKLLRERGKMTTSELWRELDCHLWELDYVLKKLKREGILEEWEM